MDEDAAFGRWHIEIKLGHASVSLNFDDRAEAENVVERISAWDGSGVLIVEDLWARRYLFRRPEAVIFGDVYLEIEKQFLVSELLEKTKKRLEDRRDRDVGF